MPVARITTLLVTSLAALSLSLSACSGAPTGDPAASVAVCPLGEPRFSLADAAEVVITMEADIDCAPSGMTLLVGVFAGGRVTPLGLFKAPATTLVDNTSYLTVVSKSFWTKDRDFGQLEVVTLLLATPAANRLELGVPIVVPQGAQLRHTGKNVVDPLGLPGGSQ